MRAGAGLAECFVETFRNNAKPLSDMTISGLTRACHSPILRAMLNFGDRAASAVRRTLSASLLALLSAVAVAAPEATTSAPLTASAAPVAVPAVAAATATDPVARFLIDRGLLNASAASLPGESAFVSRLRDRASDMVLTAMNFLGVPYRRGGNSAEQGFDCSGFTRHVFEASLGLLLPRRADEQAKTAGLLNIERSELKPGDLVFFNTLRRTFSHVGIYVGEGRFIHAPRPGGEVRVEDMGVSYWSTRFTGARRADIGADVGPVTPSVQADPAAATPPVATLRNVY